MLVSFQWLNNCTEGSEQFFWSGVPPAQPCYEMTGQTSTSVWLAVDAAVAIVVQPLLQDDWQT